MKKKQTLIERVSKDRKSIYSLAILFIAITMLVIGIITLINDIYLSAKYKEYKIKMENYGLSTLYNNKKANSYQKVTKSEAIKVIVGSVLNIKDASDLTGMTKKQYKNQDFVNYAINQGIIGQTEVTKRNQRRKAKYVDTSIVIIDTLEKLLNKKPEESKTTKYSNINKYTVEDQKEILKAAALNLYNKKSGNLINDSIYKGELNKMIVTIVEKYATIYYNSSKTDVSLVTDIKKMPSNASEFPYIVSNITKSEYEMPFDIRSKERYMSPKDEYEKRIELYAQTDDKITTYFNTILNVDYQTIKNDEFYESIKDVLAYDYTNTSMDAYVKYVKDNKIQLKGKATVMLPIIYNDGEFNRVRVKIEFRILNSNTNKNILFPDMFTGDNIKYTGRTFTFYADIQMGIVLLGKSLRVYVKSLPDDIVGTYTKIQRINEN